MFKVMVPVPPVILVSMVVFVVLSRKVYREFGWEVYRLVNASPRLKREHSLKRKTRVVVHFH
jgi:hypothetical protein